MFNIMPSKAPFCIEVLVQLEITVLNFVLFFLHGYNMFFFCQFSQPLVFCAEILVLVQGEGHQFKIFNVISVIIYVFMMLIITEKFLFSFCEITFEKVEHIFIASLSFYS